MRGYGRTGIGIGIVLFFLALRVPMLLAREPFFDELLTVWYARKPLSQHWSILAGDSGSPLYLAIARLVQIFGEFSVTGGRLLSLVFGLAALGTCLSFRDLGASRWTAAAALAAFPPHIFFSTEARAYSLAATLIGVATFALYRWKERGTRWYLTAAVIALVLAAYSHSYGVLFFPLPFVVSLLTRNRRSILVGLAASAATGVLFLPGFWLASEQPLTSIDWMRASTLPERLALVAGSFFQLGFAAPYQPVLLTPPPLWLQIVSIGVVATVVGIGVRKSSTARFFGTLILVPIGAVFAFAAAGKTFYFPTRFESTMSVPFALLLASALAVIPRKAAVAGLATLITIGGLVAVRSTLAHAGEPLTPYRAVARFLTAPGLPDLDVVVSGYAYLEVISAIGEEGVTAYPAEQALHPGWVGPSDAAALATELPGLPRRFVWVGVAGTPEAAALARRFNLRMIFNEGPVVAALAEEKA
ncbi:MAG: hypothetical protein ABIO78_09090 [Thermoanaerobaculia bacterium]